MSDLCIRDLVYKVNDGTRNKTLLKIDNLKINSGSHCVLKGASGSGKTTFLRLISGIVTPQNGDVCWGGVNISKLQSTQRDRWRGLNVGFLFQDFRLFDGLSALENVLLPCGFYGKATQNDKTRAKDLLDVVGVCPTTRTSHLSRGEMQRTALARLLMMKPSVILAAEPTASLDTQNAQHVLDLLVTVAKEVSATLIVASHDPSILQRFDRCLKVQDETVLFEN